MKRSRFTNILPISDVTILAKCIQSLGNAVGDGMVSSVRYFHFHCSYPLVACVERNGTLEGSAKWKHNVVCSASCCKYPRDS